MSFLEFCGELTNGCGYRWRVAGMLGKPLDERGHPWFNYVRMCLERGNHTEHRGVKLPQYNDICFIAALR
jgi:hypothetical protein